MSERDFVYWLQGFFEVAQPESLNKEQIKIIQDHINLVMTKVTPYSPDYPPESPVFIPSTWPDPTDDPKEQVRPPLPQVTSGTGHAHDIKDCDLTTINISSPLPWSPPTDY